MPSGLFCYDCRDELAVSSRKNNKTGERIENLARLFNIREGKGTREYDTLPWKIKNAPVPDEGPAKGAVVSDGEFQVGLDDYYEARGWTMDGIPTVEKLNELNLSEYASIVQGGKA